LGAAVARVSDWPALGATGHSPNDVSEKALAAAGLMLERQRPPVARYHSDDFVTSDVSDELAIPNAWSGPNEEARRGYRGSCARTARCSPTPKCSPVVMCSATSAPRRRASAPSDRHHDGHTVGVRLVQGGVLLSRLEQHAFLGPQRKLVIAGVEGQLTLHH
jgi:hypothetical protein